MKLESDPPQKLLGDELKNRATYAAPTFTPEVGLYQPRYPLSEVEFERLQQSNPILQSAGATFFAIFIANAIPPIIKSILVGTWNSRPSFDLQTLAFLGICFVSAVICFVLAGILSMSRNRVMRKIRGHFKANPGIATALMGNK